MKSKISMTEFNQTKAFCRSSGETQFVLCSLLTAPIWGMGAVNQKEKTSRRPDAHYECLTKYSPAHMKLPIWVKVPRHCLDGAL